MNIEAANGPQLAETGTRPCKCSRVKRQLRSLRMNGSLCVSVELPNRNMTEHFGFTLVRS